MNSEESSRVIWGHKYDYKTICDMFLFEQIREELKESMDMNGIHRILKKLIKIADKRFP
jgi:hypothetical protein